MSSVPLILKSNQMAVVYDAKETAKNVWKMIYSSAQVVKEDIISLMGNAFKSALKIV